MIETGERNLPVNEGKVNNHIVSSSNIQPASALVELGSLVLSVTNPINQQSTVYQNTDRLPPGSNTSSFGPIDFKIAASNDPGDGKGVKLTTRLLNPGVVAIRKMPHIGDQDVDADC